MSPSALHAALPVIAAAGGPALVAFNEPPSPTALNQAVALAAWGLVLLASRQPEPMTSPRVAFARTGTLLGALAIAMVCSLSSSTLGWLPLTIGLSGAAVIAMTALTLMVSASVRLNTAHWQSFFAAWILAGAASVAIAIVQVFAPEWADGDWIARSGIPGRAVGNLRQPNHLATLLLWSVVAVVPLIEWRAASGAAAIRRWNAAATALFTLLLLGVMLSGSRTGLVGVLVLTVWGLIDRRLSALSRALLVSSPLICALWWWLLDLWSTAHGAGAVGAATRVGESSDLSSARFAIWRDTLALIAQHPWLGVGFGEFNFAWSLTPSPERPNQFFDHTHNLPLQLAVELGVPVALLVLGLLGWGLWQGFDRSRRADGAAGAALRSTFVMVLLMALHSQLEYPLWYAYFLLPTAFAWGLCLGTGDRDLAAASREIGSRARWPVTAGAALLLGAALMLVDYRRVVVIFSPGEGAAPLSERIAAGRRSWFFAHHADYALVTTPDEPVTEPGAFDRATHYLLDTRLMIAWARSLDAQGDRDRARHVAARLREFRNPGSAEFFAPCDDPAIVDKPFQCEPLHKAYDWRDFQ